MDIHEQVGEFFGFGDELPFSENEIESKVMLEDLLKWAGSGELTCLVDELGVVGYVHTAHSDRVVSTLNVGQMTLDKAEKKKQKPGKKRSSGLLPQPMVDE